MIFIFTTNEGIVGAFADLSGSVFLDVIIKELGMEVRRGLEFLTGDFISVLEKCLGKEV